MAFLDDFQDAMIHVGTKTVTNTDVNKEAYVPNAAQRQVMSAAGYEPVSHTANRIIDLAVATTGEILHTTYYASVRQEPGRNPEPRIGRDLVHLIELGDTLVLGTDGETIFAHVVVEEAEIAPTHKVAEETDIKYESKNAETPEIETNNLDSQPIANVYRQMSTEKLLEQAQKQAQETTKKSTSSSQNFERNGAVRELARRRSKCSCEMTNCNYTGFEKKKGGKYIEVHHIRGLAAGGKDGIRNVAAVCPDCHKKAHYSKNSEDINRELTKVIKKANTIFLPT